MKRTHFALVALFFIGVYACKKSAEDPASSSLGTTLAASTTQATVGEPVSFTLTSKNNTGNWSVLPATNVTQAFGITSSRVNYITFNQAGVYRVSVLTRNLLCDSTRPGSLDSCWHHTPGGEHGGGHGGGHDTLGHGGGHDTCGHDSAWIRIVVRNK